MSLLGLLLFVRTPPRLYELPEDVYANERIFSGLRQVPNKFIVPYSYFLTNPLNVLIMSESNQHIFIFNSQASISDFH
jgi:hypothetical protein